MNESDLTQLRKNILKKILSKEAFERLGRIKVAKPEFGEQLELYILQLYEAGKITKEISDEQLKQILELLSPKKKFRIIK